MIRITGRKLSNQSINDNNMLLLNVIFGCDIEVVVRISNGRSNIVTVAQAGTEEFEEEEEETKRIPNLMLGRPDYLG